MCGKYKKCIFPCKSEDEFRILTEECLTFETITSCLAQRLPSHVLAGLWAVALSCTFSPDFKIAGGDVSGGDNYSIPGRFCTEFSSNPMSSGVVRILQGRTPDIACSPMTSAISMFEYFKGALQTAVYAVFSALLFSALLFSGM